MCPEGTSGSVPCLYQENWASGLCVERDTVMRCPRCRRPYCPLTPTLTNASGVGATPCENLYSDCTEEASNVDDEESWRKCLLCSSHRAADVKGVGDFIFSLVTCSLVYLSEYRCLYLSR